MWLAIFTENISIEVILSLLSHSLRQLTPVCYFVKIVFPRRFNCDSRRGIPELACLLFPSNPGDFILNSDIVRFIPAFSMDSL